MEINSELKGTQLRQYTLHLFEIIDNYILETKNYQEEPLRFYYTIVLKIFSLLDAGSSLVSCMDERPHYIDTLYVSMRTCMLDIICLLFVYDKHDQVNIAKEHVQKIMSDHIRAFYNSAENEKEKTAIREKFPNYFDNGKLKNDKGLSTKYMVDKVVNFPQLTREAKHAFHIYTVLSKFEHNGYFTFDILHGHHIGEGKKKAKAIIISAICICIVVFSAVLRNWIDKDDPAYLKLNELSTDFLSKHT